MSLRPPHSDTSTTCTESLPQSGNKLEVHFQLTATWSTQSAI